MKKIINTKVVVIGSGPAGYSAAFRCSDLGLNTVLIERYENLGGVCLNVGCIPSKTLLHVAKIYKDNEYFYNKGIFFNKPKINFKILRNWKKNIIKKINFGLNNMAKNRNVKIVYGKGSFINKNSILVMNNKKKIKINFKYCIIAIGSKSINLPFNVSGIWNSTDALKLKKIPKSLLIIGGGVVGLEMATLYSSFGSMVDVIDNSKYLLPMVDKDMVFMFRNIIKKQFNIFNCTNILSIKKNNLGYLVNIENNKKIKQDKIYENIIVSVGRYPETSSLKIKNIGIILNKNGFIKVNKKMRTNVDNIYAIGDIVGVPMLAHKAMHQAHIAAEVIYGKDHYFDPKVIPSIAYTNPEIAWVGMNEKDAKNNNINFEVALFPWKASGRAIATCTSCGMTKLIFDKDTNKIIGGSVIGKNSGELLSEISLAIEMGCDAEDISLTIHAHPTLYETIGLTADIFTGTITDLLNEKAK
ncbi:dihydrolipoyl dehydrogenase [Buchnera aphidicola]|uniref:dihydrolipoyl dehydrogenase n=1 Tax=Buchnera aphidicola TaxID=9 RepID=UPI0031B85FFF